MYYQEAFEKLKWAVALEAVLWLLQFDKPFEVPTNASNEAINGVLVQEGHLIDFKGRKLNGTD